MKIQLSTQSRSAIVKAIIYVGTVVIFAGAYYVHSLNH
jgi:hypothetical protein